METGEIKHETQKGGSSFTAEWRKEEEKSETRLEKRTAY